MSAIKTRLTALLLLAGSAAILASCASTTAPWGWLEPPAEAGATGFGAWTQLTIMKDSQRTRVYGELIAVHDDSIFVLGDGLRAAKKVDVYTVILTTFIPQNSTTSTWGVLGSLSSFSHGVGAIISLPLWIVFSSASSSSVSREPQEVYARGGDVTSRYDVKWEDLARFARFPQGIPESLDRTQLEPKKTTTPTEPRRRRR